jgi:hypothetical protein
MNYYHNSDSEVSNDAGFTFRVVSGNRFPGLSLSKVTLVTYLVEA